MAVQEGRGQPVVMEALVLIDVAHLKGADKLTLVVKHTHFIPLKTGMDGLKNECNIVFIKILQGSVFVQEQV